MYRRRMNLSSPHIGLGEGHGLGPELICPRCEFDYLHQGRVTIYDRSEDEDLTTVTEVSEGLIGSHRIPSDKCGNPSSRRHAVAIAFSCEGCGDNIELSFSQHKGMTYLMWRFAEIEKKPMDEDWP